MAVTGLRGVQEDEAGERPPDTAARDRLHSQFARYVVIGVISTLLDAGIYRLALPVIGIDLAKGLGYLAGMTNSVAGNHRFTFGHEWQPGTIIRCIILYGSSLLLNVAVNRAVLTALPKGGLSLSAGFVAALCICTDYNFSGMRFWIFRKAR